ncbi:MAG: TolC family protein, partial [Pseudomonadota bacterium]
GPQHPMVGWLYLDERVWAGYLQDGYYAIFDLKDKGRPESQAKGYVKAASLRKLSEEERAAMAAPAPVAKAPEPVAQPVVAPTPAPVAKAAEPKAQPAVASTPAPVAKAPEPKAQPAAAPAPAPVAKAVEPQAQPATAPAKAGMQASAPAPVAMQEKPAPAMEAKPSAPTTTRPSAAGVTVVAGKPPLPRPLTLAAAVAYAVENNLDAAVARQEQAVQEEQRTQAKWTLLPSLILESESSWKDRDVATSSRSLKTGKQSLEASISSDQTVQRQSAILSWDLLNLAVNLNRWRQADARWQSSAEHLRRVKQDLALDVTRAYMQAAVAEASAKSAHDIIDKLKKRTALVKRQVQDRTVAEVAGLEAEAHFINLIMRFKQHERKAETHRAELARLMGISRVEDVELPPLTVEEHIDKNTPKIEVLWNEAQRLRPELVALDFDKDISLRDVTSAMSRLLPSPTVFARFDHDNNSYLSESEWFTVGLKLSWDLLGMPRNLAESNVARARVMLVDKRKEAMLTAIFTQLRLASIEQAESLDDIDLLRDLNDSRSRLLTAVDGQVKQGKSHEGDLLDAEQKYLIANSEYLNSYGRLVTARARLNNSVGRDWMAK